jgi:hypothetical protein
MNALLPSSAREPLPSFGRSAAVEAKQGVCQRIVMTVNILTALS